MPNEGSSSSSDYACSPAQLEHLRFSRAAGLLGLLPRTSSALHRTFLLGSSVRVCTNPRSRKDLKSSPVRKNGQGSQLPFPSTMPCRAKLPTQRALPTALEV